MTAPFRLLLCVIFLGLNTLAAHAQDSTLTRLIGRSRYPLQVSGAQFSGAGWDKLQASVQKSQFVLLGEGHGMAQVPLFAAAVARVQQPVAFVTEVDPYVARRVTQLVAQPGLPTAYLRQYPEGLCFYDWTEEFALARTLRAQQVELVGLDQVFIMTAAPVYAELAQLVKAPAARTYFSRRAQAYQQVALTNERQHNDKAVMTDLQTPASIDSLLALAKAESPAAQQLAQDYAASYQIYTGRVAGGGGHQARLNLLRRNLLTRFSGGSASAGSTWPKLLFKFGYNHLGRGLSPLARGEYYDVGNLVQLQADVQGVTSLHILITGKQGTRTLEDNPYFPARQAESYAPQESDSLWPFFQQATGPAWSVFDLRPARRAITAGTLAVPERLRRIMQGYDYLIIIPETTASHPM